MYISLVNPALFPPTHCHFNRILFRPASCQSAIVVLTKTKDSQSTPGTFASHGAPHGSLPVILTLVVATRAQGGVPVNVGIVVLPVVLVVVVLSPPVIVPGEVPGAVVVPLGPP